MDDRPSFLKYITVCYDFGESCFVVVPAVIGENKYIVQLVS